jgi:DNA-binding NarL/FixJ family response regulator
LLLDLCMQGVNGLELIPRIRRCWPGVRILVVSMLADREAAGASLHAGAHGFIPKEASSEELLVAINGVLSGRGYLSPRVPKASHRVGISAMHVGMERLTPRQQEIVLLFGEGKSAKDIGAELHLSPSTITFHKHHIMQRLGIETDAALVTSAVLLRVGTSDGPPRAP